ncbi:hypothetical protein GIB67_003191 [Kingdonia uniflora]|uniref:Uncharacterized protein n=1 Tax=Kingdonia uniflora TaxID=39325 RepID=A0A7J7P2W7_9MAGN|nr:hypothetical protein GIB67_003191 [Kingdonia uniflora]
MTKKEIRFRSEAFGRSAFEERATCNPRAQTKRLPINIETSGKFSRIDRTKSTNTLEKYSVNIGKELLKGAVEGFGGVSENTCKSTRNIRVHGSRSTRNQENSSENGGFTKTNRHKQPLLAITYSAEATHLASENKSSSIVAISSPKSHSDSSSSHQEKRRISNVVAKLMGLEQLSAKLKCRLEAE